MVFPAFRRPTYESSLSDVILSYCIFNTETICLILRRCCESSSFDYTSHFVNSCHALTDIGDQVSNRLSKTTIEVLCSTVILPDTLSVGEVSKCFGFSGARIFFQLVS